MTGSRWQQAVTSSVVVTCAAGALALAGPAAAAPARTAAAAAAGRADHPAAPASPGTNLLLNAGAQAGAFSARGWDAVTIPGWQVLAGLPTVVRYGSARFPARTGHQPAVRGGQLFAGGAGGTARLRQIIPLRSGPASWPAGTRFRLSAWLGGDRRSRSGVVVTFLSGSGRALGHAAIGPAGGRSAAVTITPRATGGIVPPGTKQASVVLTLATSLRHPDGPYAPYAGYDRAVADDLRFSVSASAPRRVLSAPAARTPRYQHVFLFYFENEDYRSVIGNKALAPYLNSLLPRGSLLGNFFAEEHPSDGNYLALAGGSTFGVPLTDPLEENSQYTIRARNIGDLIDSAHKTWKAYLQSANGPCDDTVHGYYWDDDMPMTYFADVRDRPAYCAAHLVPLQSLSSDLASAATTPSFSWISPNDCADMEGCGIADGDRFLATELGAIMASRAWRTQRSLAIITFDEDRYDYQHPAQRVATVILGSAGVRHGYVSAVRYTHYSLLRTIESALGLGTLTANDRYAQPVNDVFPTGPPAAAQSHPASARPGPAGAGPAKAAARPRVTVPATGAAPAQQTAFVVNSASGTVSPVNLATRRAGRPIPVGKDPQAIAITPDGAAAYVVNSGSGTVTPFSTTTRRAGTPIRVGRDPQAIAIAPDGRTAYVTDAGSDNVTPIDLLTGLPGLPIPVGPQPHAIAITPDGRTALVLNWGGASVTPVDLRTGRAGRPIPVGSYPVAVAMAHGGGVAYVASFGAGTVTPISLRTRRAGLPVPSGQATDALAVTPDGGQVYAVGGDSDTVTPIGVRAWTAAAAIPVGSSPEAVAIPAAGQTAFVANTINSSVTPVAIATGNAGRPIPVGSYSYPTAISLAPSGPLAIVLGGYGGEVTLLNTSTRRAVANISVGSYPVAVATAP